LRIPQCPRQIYSHNCSWKTNVDACFVSVLLCCKMARWEHNTRILSRSFRSSKLACAVLAVTIILLGIYRDWRYGNWDLIDTLG